MEGNLSDSSKMFLTTLKNQACIFADGMVLFSKVLILESYNNSHNNYFICKGLLTEKGPITFTNAVNVVLSDEEMVITQFNFNTPQGAKQ
jgi:hypothetical protein